MSMRGPLALLSPGVRMVRCRAKRPAGRGPIIGRGGEAMPTQAEKGRLFKERPAQPGIIVLPNPWDAGTAKLLQSMGFEALATTSLGMSIALGRPDGENAVSRAELIANCRQIAAATDLPVNADLENGYADDPKEAASILREAAEAGIVAGSIEDWDGERIYDF